MARADVPGVWFGPRQPLFDLQLGADLLQPVVLVVGLDVRMASGSSAAGTKARKKTKPPSKEAVAALLAEADDDLRLVIMFAAATAARAGEQWALRWRHLDLAGAEVTIETRVDVYGEEDTTKTEAVVRQFR